MNCPFCHDLMVACACRRDPVRLVDDPSADAGDAAFERVRAEVRRRLVRYVGGAS